MEQKKFERINELAAKKKIEGLTEEELLEQKALHEEYISAYRQSLEAALSRTIIVDEEGNRRPVKKKDKPE